MKQLFTMLLFCMATLCAISQEYKLGNVTKAELEEKTYLKDPSAPAAVLYSKSENYMVYSESKGFLLYTDVEMKIKIYTKEGYAYANKVVSYYNSPTQNEVVNFSKAYTYNLLNGKIEKTKLKSEGEFDEVVNKSWKSKKIMMPDVKEGSIVEFKYTIMSPFISTLPDWKFQQDIPVAHSELTTRMPEYFVFNPNFRGYFAPQVKTSRIARSITFNNKQRSTGLVTTTSFSSDKIDYMETTNSYVLNDLPALKDESYVSNMENYAAGVEHEINMIHYPGETVKSFANSWEDVAKTIYKYDDFGPELKKTGYFEDDIKPLTAALTTPEEKAATIFSYVKTGMNWNGSYGYGCDLGVKKAYKEKVGNVADINLMLTAMLRFSGLDANPVLVSTRSHKIALFPSHSAFNYVICGVKLGGKMVLLDANEKSAMPNVLPVRAINWAGRLIKDDGTSESIDLTPKSISKEVVSVSVKLDNAGKCTGKLRNQYFDHNAYIFRENYLGLSKESYLEKLEGRHKGLEVGEYKVANEKDLTKPVAEEYDFAYSNASEIIGDKIYVNPMFFFTTTENPFKQEKREYPVDFVFPHEDKYMISIALPEGFVVESLPAPIAVTMEEGVGNFKYTLQQQGNNIQLMIIDNISYGVVPADYYETLKGYFQKIIDKQNEKIVLKKA
ncbi:DUF3857 domain-containing protein [Flavobacterium psychrotrophum]|uniref:DUF3857 domain-containing protein n=1 Tax=Flavobacterium psychrotrophum TaxID=2294119 RepID=UPI000E321CCA|nr:DUF3857 domain-containing protein [Flavobacterium psychrotrophum]